MDVPVWRFVQKWHTCGGRFSLNMPVVGARHATQKRE